MIGTDIHQAAAWLRRGELVAVPTETVYGLAGNAFDPDAVLRIFQVKQRPRFNPLIVHVAGIDAAMPLVAEMPPAARRLAEACWPGPLTLLLPRSAAISDLVTAGSPLVALRVPAHPLTLSLLRLLEFPLCAPSANPFGYISPTTAAHVEAQLGGAIPYILDGGPAQVGIESTIIGFDEQARPRLYRAGGLAPERIEALAGPLLSAPHSDSPAAPGMLKSHYAPRTPLFFGDMDELLKEHGAEGSVLLLFSAARKELPVSQQLILSPAGDLSEAARKLFAAMRQLDAMGAARILAAPFPEAGLGFAINDRLKRASM